MAKSSRHPRAPNNQLGFQGASLRLSRGARESPEHPTNPGIGFRGDEGGRTRGAQPGNLNALKHGFYSKHMHPDELAELAEASAASLNGEIGLTRVAARRVLGLLDEAKDADERVALLNAITMAAMRVASLLKTKKYLSADGGDMTAALQEALKDVALETDPGIGVRGANQ